MRKLIYITLTLSLLTSCGSISDVFQLKKGNTGDEFLVEKKNPLVLPPEFNELPQPENLNMESDINEDKFEEKIFNSEDEDKNKDTTSGTGSTEDFILKNIKKNESD